MMLFPEKEVVVTRSLSSRQLAEAAALLRQGGVAVFPTDTVYGVAALADDADAVAALFRAKARPTHTPLPVMVAAPEQVAAIARPTPRFWPLARAFWPGPLTIILPGIAALPGIVTAGRNTVALRIPDHPLALALLRLVDAPLAVTSANLSGRAPALDAAAAWEQLQGRVDAIIDGGPAPGGQPSTIVDLTGASPRILRRGPITRAQIQAA